MTYTAALTRIHLNLNHPVVRRDLADRVGLHKTLMRLAPDPHGPHPRQQAGLLFRLEHHHQPSLLIQTTHPPHLDGLPTRYGTVQTRDLAPVLHHLRAGQTVLYRITAAPTRHKPAPVYGHRPDGTPLRPRGIRTPLRDPDDALAWWHRQAAVAGLTLTFATLTPRPFPRRDRDSPYHVLVQFDGHATIADPHALAAALCSGIGQGKPYGAGLLSLAPSAPHQETP
ncbi:type I-E CRISPR-associated protein Cas6/Cse3/CasE [Streptomyces sp. CA-132043]|uniref:type I-E CRISPR-associated protein Cas6/Cse3/CasE n=1 Tax=Streptomyces sp. CA-132043 TaxID=3240048 RepID=UPI003D94C0C2